MQEKGLPSEGDPLLWWKLRKHEFPILSRLARKYLCIQATSTPAERIFSKLGLILVKNRLRMTGEKFKEIMFLSDKI